MITLYSTGCPQCSVLKKKLDQANIEYSINTDQATMLAMGLVSVPALQVNDTTIYNFSDAVKWIKEQQN